MKDSIYVKCENINILQYVSIVQLHSNFQIHGYIKRKLLNITFDSRRKQNIFW